MPRIAVDSTCPSCKHPERYYDPETDLFGCSQCNHTSAGND